MPYATKTRYWRCPNRLAGGQVITPVTAPVGAARLGFGCARLPGSLSANEALTLLEAALDSGVRHFDTAPLYGWGAAEPLLGELARRRRGEMTIVTKAGIAPPGLAARAIAKLSRAPAHARFNRFAPAQVRRSLDASLRALRTDHVEALLLHEIEPHQMSDELLRLMQEFKRGGKAAAIGLATSAEATSTLLRAHPQLFDVVQLPYGATMPDGVPIVVHSVLTSNVDRMSNRLAHDMAAARRFEDRTGVSAGDRRALGELLLREALWRNAGGTVLFSSTRLETIRRNAQLPAEAPITAELLT